MNDNDKSKVNAFVLDNELFITVWLDAEIGDVLEEISVDIDGDEVWFDEIDPGYVFGSKVVKFPVIQVNEIPDEDFEITVFADFSKGEDQEFTPKVDLEDLDEEEDEDDEEDMDEDMYPAAPAIANKLLKNAGIPNRVDGVNLIAAVSAAMAEDEAMNGIEKDDEDYADEVEEFLFEKLNDILDKNEIGELDFDDDELSDFAELLADINKTVGKPETQKIKVEITEVKNNDKVEDDDEDEVEDEDEDEDEGHGKGKKN
jgi:hypothetical protein